MDATSDLLPGFDQSSDTLSYAGLGSSKTYLLPSIILILEVKMVEIPKRTAVVKS